MTKSATPISSVWDTLNAMKARQQAAASTAAQHRQTDLSRRDAQLAFEAVLARARTPADVFAQLRKDKAVRAVVNGHKKRVGGEVERELKALKQGLGGLGGDLVVVAEAVRRANEGMHRIR